MLKRIVVNQKMIPVPVPLKTLSEVCTWVDDTLVAVGQTVTSAILDGKDVLDYWGMDKICSSISVHDEMRLELRVESPEDLAFQTLDTIHALAGTVLGGLKALAVHLWQSRQNDIQPELASVVEDITLICALIERLKELAGIVQLDVQALSQNFEATRCIKARLGEVMANGNWREAAQILLRDTAASHGLETILKIIAKEAEIAHAALLKIKHESAGGLVGLSSK
jgi:hypothetical protein